MFLLLITVAFAAQSKWRTECNSQAVASWNNIDDKTGFGKAFFANWISSNPSIEKVFADSSFPQGPAQFLVERFDILLNVIDDEDQLAEQLYQVAKTHKKVGVDQSDLYSFQASFMKTLPSFDSDFTAETGNAWAYTLSHVITAPLVEMAAVTSSYVGVRVVREAWKKVDQKQVCDSLLDKVMKAPEISDFFKGVDKSKQSLLFCSFVDVIMEGLTLPGDDSEKRNSQMKQLAAFHNGMGVGGSAYLIFEEALINSFRDVLGEKWDRTTKHSFVYALHKQVFDVLVRYTQKWYYAPWKAPVRAAAKSCAE
jgi:hemoglobin-like flavoprotein